MNIRRSGKGFVRLPLVLLVLRVFFKERSFIMSNGLTVVSYALAAMAGICFVKGLAVLSGGRRKYE